MLCAAVLFSFFISLDGLGLSTSGVRSVVEVDMQNIRSLKGLVDVRDVFGTEKKFLIVFPKISQELREEIGQLRDTGTKIFPQNLTFEFERGPLMYVDGLSSDRRHSQTFFLPQGVWFEIEIDKSRRDRIARWASEDFLPGVPNRPCTLYVQEILRRLELTDFLRLELAPHLLMKQICSRGLFNSKIDAHLIGVKSLHSAYESTRGRDLIAIDELENRLSKWLSPLASESNLRTVSWAVAKILPCLYPILDYLPRRTQNPSNNPWP